MSERRLLLVHAHPDDESINNGATMAKYVAEGAKVTLITCTKGEEGEVSPGAVTERTSRISPPCTKIALVAQSTNWAS